MNVFDLDPSRVGTGRAFPDEIEDMDWIGYHCTSSVYSTSIETNGFNSMKPIPVADLDFVISAGKAHGVEVGDVEIFKLLYSVSFSPISEVALSYSALRSVGGQGLEYVRIVADDLLASHVSSLSPEDSTRLSSILDGITQIRAGMPVVYAVRLDGIALIEYQKFTRGIYVRQAIEPDRIVAKLCVSNPIDESKIDLRGHREAVRKMREESPRHFVAGLPEG